MIAPTCVTGICCGMDRGLVNVVDMVIIGSVVENARANGSCTSRGTEVENGGIENTVLFGDLNAS